MLRKKRAYTIHLGQTYHTIEFILQENLETFFVSKVSIGFFGWLFCFGWYERKRLKNRKTRLTVDLFRILFNLLQTEFLIGTNLFFESL